MFEEKTLDFLMENRLQNSRQWFSEHRGEYEKYVLNPLAELAVELAPTLFEIDPQIISVPKVDRCISRIYRDMRRCRDGMLYRDEMWLTFKRDKHEFPCYPEFFFVISPSGLLYGCGYYDQGGGAAECLRQLIIAEDPAFVKADRAYRAQSALPLAGDVYKKSRYPQYSDRQRDWLERKNICLMRSAELPLLYSPELGKTLSRDFKAVRAVYELLVKSEQEARKI